MESNTITYSTQIIYNKTASWRKNITHEGVDNYDFEHNNFIEIIDKAEYIRPYFDFDEIETTKDYDNVITWLNSLKDVFGEYAIGGYTKLEEFTHYGFKFIKDAHHILSFHVVFYEAKIKSSWLIEIMKCKDKKYIHKNINEFCDPNVYKLGTRQLMRHPLSNKYYGRNHKDNTTTAGSLLNFTKPSNLILTPNGTENEIDADDIIKTFSLPDNFFYFDEMTEEEDEEEDIIIKPVAKKQTEQQPIKRSHHKQQQTIEDIEYVDGLITFNKKQLIEFIDKLNIDNNTNGILVQLAPLYHSPFNKSFLIEAVSEWYEQEQHDHPENVENFINRYYTKEHNNKWFYSLLKKFGNDEVRNEYIKIHKDHIDMTININNSELTFDDIKERKYNINNMPKLLNDLRGVIGNIDDKWYIKTIKNEQKFIRSCTDEQLRAKTKTTKPFIMNTKINMYQILMKYSDMFRYKTAKMVKDNTDDKNINLFQGYKYKEIITDDFTIIQTFLNHIKNIICCKDEEKYIYFLTWWANIIQHITVKNTSMPIIYGGQGSGKSFVVETLCELLGNYALCNVDDLDKVFGKFNGLIGMNLVININEPPEAGEKFQFNGKIKSKLTQKKIVIETKGIDQIEIDSYANYILTTNSYGPVKEEKGGRRYIYYETDNSKCGDEEYFNNLCKPAQPIKQGDYNPEFMGVLLHYLLTQIDTTDFNGERLIRKINKRSNVEYNEQLDRQYTDCSAIDRFVIDHYKDFVEGIDTNYIKQHMTNIPSHTVNSISRALNTICDKKRVQRKGVRLMEYYLKPREQIQDLYNIIDYREYNGLIEDPIIRPLTDETI